MDTIVFDKLVKLPVWEQVVTIMDSMETRLQQIADEFKIDMQADKNYCSLVESIQAEKQKAQLYGESHGEKHTDDN